MKADCIMGVDSGNSGAVAFFFPSHHDRVSVDDFPLAHGQICGGQLYDRIRQMAPDVAIVELVHAMPGQGVSSTFTFGRAFGTVVGVIQAAGVPLHFVSPRKWKNHFGLSSDKEASRELALRLFPKTQEHFRLKKHHGRAEAALIALYGARAILTQRAA